MAAVSALAAAGLVIAGCSASSGPANQQLDAQHLGPVRTATPIKHVVVLFDENISFDHYFGTYPNATNTDGTPFHALPGTPKVNGLSNSLLTDNPNSYNPKRLDPSQALTCDQNHSDGPEQKAYDNGKADKFVQNTETDVCTGEPILFGEPGLVMDYYDGNTVTGLWNYAQHYSLNDNSYDSQFGPSTPGALNLVAGQTYGGYSVDPKTGQKVGPVSSVIGSPNAQGIGTVYADSDPAYDDCSDTNHTTSSDLVAMQGKNIGDLLNQRNVTWGWFQGGFKPTSTANGYAVCGATHTNVGGISDVDYSAHHNPFEYYKSTANPKHLPPSSPFAIGHTDQANHEYDLSDFNTALKYNNLPSVSFLKAPEAQDAHAGYSDPLDEQTFLTSEINSIEKSPEWSSTAIVVAYDDSDGWYDHQNPTVINGSHDAANDSTECTSVPTTLGSAQDRCGEGPRLPLLVISPWSKRNYVDNTNTNQASITQFIENNWSLGRVGNGSYDQVSGSLNNMFNFRQFPNIRPLILNTKTGAVVSGGGGW
ncbi:MAG TPA: alkaline phosphatase family protein [Pseudonocardiaceae bacterium]|nr:alkaline phosphatase family protein [Pseudonocardiaceae bacterium]